MYFTKDKELSNTLETFLKNGMNPVIIIEAIVAANQELEFEEGNTPAPNNSNNPSMKLNFNAPDEPPHL